MAQTTQKEAIKISKEKRFEVLSFDDNGRRHSSYAGIDIFKAMNEVVIHTSQGRRVLIFDFNDPEINLTRMEVRREGGGRITYDEVKHLALTNISRMIPLPKKSETVK